MNRWISSAAATVLAAASAFFLRVPGHHGAGLPERAERNQSDISIVTVAERPQRLPPAPPPLEQAASAAGKAEPAVQEAIAAADADDSADVPCDDSADAPPLDAGGGADLSDGAAAQAERYRQYALGRIASKKAYPLQARAKGVEGRVRVRLEILPDGSVASVSVVEGSGSPLLDDACLAAVRKASPFKKMPPASSALTLVFAMDFTLD
ncbi:MAG: energy transducer TonB [Treponemataceae bacterium]|nr:energy transducer TonB [Treponemataceae bacterium]